MKLKALDMRALNDYDDCEIEDIVFRIDDVRPGSLFFCLRGSHADGHTFAREAEEKGAVAFVCEERLDTEKPHVIVENSRRQLALSCAAFYGYPSRRMKIVAVTGTNGKTTTTYIVKSILENCGYKVGLIGTNCVMIGEERQQATLTTPDPTDLHRIFAHMAEKGVEYVVMEASAHALWLHKLDGIVFEVAAFTNLSHDHLDYFKTMESYAEAKEKLFQSGFSKKQVVNIDDAFGRKLAMHGGSDLITYGCENPCDVFAIDLKMSVDGLEYFLNSFDDIADIKFNLPGRFNMYNTLCAAAIGAALDIPLKHVVRGIRRVNKIEGRFNMIGTAKASVIIDFAHTPDGLKNILTSIREFADKRIITVFGCGGDRDAMKRPIMGETVSELSDLCVVTSDNPRSESPEKIIDDIVGGMKKDNFVRIADRKEAIKYALSIANSGDIILIAGKGAENYQEIDGIKYDYNDEHYIMEILEEGNL